MKIAFLILNLSNGGAERVISILSEELVKKGNQITLILERRVEDEYYIHPEVTVFTMDSYGYDRKNGNSISRTIKRVHTIRKIIKKDLPDVVIPFIGNLIRDTYFAQLGLKCRFIPAVRNNLSDMTGMEKKLLDFIFSKSDAIFLQNNEQKKFLSKNAESKAFVVPNPISRIFIECGKNRLNSCRLLNYVTLGRLVPQKNHIMLINAFVEAHKSNGEITLDIYGVGDLYDKLQSLIDRLQANKFIRLMGRTNDSANTLLKYDVFVLSSDFEGMPNALMEAMATGMLCISSDCPTGPHDLIGNNERGILFEVGKMKQLEDIIVSVSRDSTCYNGLGKKARDYVTERYIPEAIVEEFLSKI